MAAYRLLNFEGFEPGALLAPHQEAVAKRCSGHACVVVSQDTTEFDYSHMKETSGLGPLNDEKRRGFYMHSLYAVSEQGLPLGLLDAAIIWAVSALTCHVVVCLKRRNGNRRVPW